MKTHVIQDEPDEPAPQPSAAPPAGKRQPANPAGRMGRWIVRRRRIALWVAKLRLSNRRRLIPFAPSPKSRGYSLPLSPQGQVLNGPLLDITVYNPSWVWAAGNLISNLDDLAVTAIANAILAGAPAVASTSE
jgi:hypothetical protein